MNEMVIEKIEHYISKIAEGLGVASEYLMNLFTKQMFWEGIAGLAVWVIVGVLLFTLTYLLYKSYTVYETEDGYDTDKEAFFGIFGIILIIVDLLAILIFVFTFTESVLKIANPEYYALKQILELVSSMTK